MRKLFLFIALILGTLAIAGCGSGSGDDTSSPLDNALRYLPADAPFAVAIETDTNGEQFGAARELVDEFPFGDQVEKQLRDMLEERAGQLEQIEAALGNEFVVGTTDAKTFLETPRDGDQTFVGAIQVKDQDALDKLVEGDKAEADGEVDGAKLYKDDSGDTFAIDGDVLVVASSRKEIEQALATHGGDDSLTEEKFEAGTEGVAGDALVRVYLDVAGLLRASPDAKDALRSKWVSALTTAGIALSFEEDDEVKIDVDVNTDSEDLTDADLPIAAGAASPKVMDREGAVNLALREPSQVLEFAQATLKAVDPDESANFEQVRDSLKSQLKIDLQADVIDQLDGDLAVSIDLDGKFGARAELKDPAEVRQTVAKLGKALSGIVQGAAGEKVGVAKPKGGEDFYAVATASGGQIVFGVVDDFLVVSNSAAIAGTLANAETDTVDGAKGALVLSGDAQKLGQTALKEAAGKDLGVGQQLVGAIGTRPLDDLTGGFEITTDGLSGSFTLTTD